VGKHTKAYNLASTHGLYLTNLPVKDFYSVYKLSYNGLFTAMLLRDFSRFVFEGAMGCFFSCSVIVADRYTKFTPGLNSGHHFKGLNLMRNGEKASEGLTFSTTRVQKKNLRELRQLLALHLSMR